MNIILFIVIKAKQITLSLSWP